MKQLIRAHRNWLAVPVLLCLFGFLACPVQVSAQELDRELKELFEGMLDELSPSVRLKFEKAIQTGAESIEFEKEEFRKFRSNPVNPFDGMDAIDPDKLDGNIVLKFELPSLRSRQIELNERQHQSQLNQLAPITNKVRKSVVKLVYESRQIALGTITEAGVLTKASEVADLSGLKCVFHNGAQQPVEVVKIDRANDVALLRINNELSPGDRTFKDFGSPVRFANTQLLPGAFVAASNEKGKPIAIGTYSTTPRSTAVGKRAFLGVQPKAVASGIYVENIDPNTAAAEAGLKNGDVITRLDGKEMREVGDLVNHIRKHQPGDSIRIDYVRGTSAGSAVARLSGSNFSGQQAAQFKMMSRLGAVPSKRSDNFPFVFQHDMPLFPEQCGGPVLDLEGNVVGINIARNGRAATFAIPVAHLNTIIGRLTANSSD